MDKRRDLTANQIKISNLILGNDKNSLKTESSANYRPHAADKSNSPSPKDEKSHFVFGCHQSPYVTTASTSFELPLPSRFRKASRTPSKNIILGYEKIKKVSIGHSDFTEKKNLDSPKNELNKIKAIHDHCHFTLGHFSNDYSSSKKDYRKFSATPSEKLENLSTVSVVFGNFKPVRLTENQEKFRKIKISSPLDLKDSSYLKNSYISLGNFKETPLATSQETYKGEQNIARETAQGVLAKGTNVILGKFSQNWKSSYQNSFEEKEIKITQKLNISKRKNFELGYRREVAKSLAKDSYTVKTPVSLERVLRPDMICLGKFKRKFETVNSTYGSM